MIIIAMSRRRPIQLTRVNFFTFKCIHYVRSSQEYPHKVVCDCITFPKVFEVCPIHNNNMQCNYNMLIHTRCFFLCVYTYYFCRFNEKSWINTMYQGDTRVWSYEIVSWRTHTSLVKKWYYIVNYFLLSPFLLCV